MNNLKKISALKLLIGQIIVKFNQAEALVISKFWFSFIIKVSFYKPVFKTFLFL